MRLPATVPRAALAVTVVLASGAACKSSTAPGNSQSSQGTVSLSVFQLAIVTFKMDATGTFSSRVDWTAATNDVNTVLVRGRCTMEQILLESGTCSDVTAVAKDNSPAKPSSLSISLQPGDYTLVILN